MLRFLDFLIEKNVFLHLFNISVSASFLVLAVLVLRFLLKKAPRWSVCLLWGLVGLRLVFPFSIESVFSLIPSAETVSPDIVYQAEPKIHSGIQAMDNIINPVLIQNFAPARDTVTSVNPLQVVFAVATILWLLGVMAILLYILIGYICLRLRLRTSVKMTERIYQSERVHSPFIFGMLKPRIYLPFAMDASDMEHVIAHERAHLRRLDHLTKPFAYLILAVYWFNPLLWVAYLLLCRDIELACDEKVVREMDADAKKAYSMALLKCSMNQKTRLACPLAFGEVGVKERVQNVMHYKKPAFWIIMIAVIAVIVTAVCFLTVPKGKETEFLFYRPVKIVGEDTVFASNEKHPVSLHKYYMILSTGGDFFEWNEYDGAWYSMVGGSDGVANDSTTEIKSNKNEMRSWFSDAFVFEGDHYGGNYLNLDLLYAETKAVYFFEHTDKDGEKWINYLFYQQDSGLYWGCGFAEDGYIRVLCQLERMENPLDMEYTGYYQVVENIGSHTVFSWQPNVLDYPYYHININGLLLSQERGGTSWTLLGHLSEMNIAAARETVSKLLTMPFAFYDESEIGGNSTIRNTILAGISGMWTLTREENDTEWTYYFIQVNNGTMYFGQGHDGILRWLYRMEEVAQYETYAEPTVPSATIVSSTSHQSDLEIEATTISFDDRYIRLKVSFTNASYDQSFYLRGSSLFSFADGGYYEPFDEYQDNCAPIYLGAGQVVSRDFIFERSYMENNSYALNLFLKINDINVEGICGYVVFNLKNF